MFFVDPHMPQLPICPGQGTMPHVDVRPKVDFKFSGDMQIGNFPFIKAIMPDSTALLGKN